jgi:hypothetical protein
MDGLIYITVAVVEIIAVPRAALNLRACRIDQDQPHQKHLSAKGHKRRRVSHVDRDTLKAQDCSLRATSLSSEAVDDSKFDLERLYGNHMFSRVDSG